MPKTSNEHVKRQVAISYTTHRATSAADGINEGALLPYPIKEVENQTQVSATYRFPYPLPNDFLWEKILIHFKNGFDVTIKTNGKIHETNFKKMGFNKESSAVPTPDKQWWFFHELARYEGETNKGFLNNLNQKERNQLKSRKKVLVSKLRNYFGLTSDPFYNYKVTNSYRIKIVLLPESVRGESTVDETGEDPLGIQEVFQD